MYLTNLFLFFFHSLSSFLYIHLYYNFVVLSDFLQGLYLEITGPTQKDLKLRAHLDYEEVSRAMSGRSIGFFIGAAIGGFLVDKLDPYCDLMVAVCLDLGATATIVAPHAQEIALLWFLFVMQGTFEGIINIGKIQFPFNTPSCRRIRVKPLEQTTGDVIFFLSCSWPEACFRNLAGEGFLSVVPFTFWIWYRFLYRSTDS